MADTIQARIIAYKVREDRNGNPLVEVLFQTADQKTFTWFGSLKDGKARDITIDTLVKKLGLNTRVENVAGGLASNALDAGTIYELKIEPWTDAKGEVRNGIKGIYLPGEKPEELDKEKLKSMLGATSIEDEVAAKIAKYPPRPRAVPAPAQKTGTDNSDIPF